MADEIQGNLAEVETPVNPAEEQIESAPDAEGQEPGEQAETKPASGDGDQEKERRKWQKGVDRRIGHALREAQEAREARVAAETELRLLREQLGRSAKQNSSPDPEKEPSIDDFETVQEFNRAVARYEARKESERASRETLSKVEKTRREEMEAAQQAEYRRAFVQRCSNLGVSREELQEASQTLKDAGLDISIAIATGIAESEVGPAVMRYLGQHIEEVERINAMTPARQLIELGKLELKVTPEGKKPTEALRSKAPAPPRPVNGSSTAGFNIGNPKWEDPKFVQWYMAQRDAGKLTL